MLTHVCVSGFVGLSVCCFSVSFFGFIIPEDSDSGLRLQGLGRLVSTGFRV